MAILGTSISLMLLVVFVQNRKMGWRTIYFEVLVTVIGLKPALDAYRIVRSNKKVAGKLFEPLIEMSYTKGAEMFAEAIPGVLIQLAAILSDGRASIAAIISLAVSALTTGFISATVSPPLRTPARQHIKCPGCISHT